MTSDVTNAEKRTMSVDMIDEDRDNREIYGEYETDGLAESIEENGYQGSPIIVYPEKDRYTIQSGHRTLEAAKKAGRTYVPVLVIEAPRNEIERRKRLILSNLHGRRYTPMRMARQAQYLFDTYKMEQKLNRAEGREQEGKLLEKVASDLEISTSQVTKYRQLLQLNGRLQQMADSGMASWSALAKASQLTDAQQNALASKITGRIKLGGPESITRSWLENEINECRYYILDDDETMYEYDPNDMTFLSEELAEKLGGAEAGKRKRRSNSAVTVRRCLEMMEKGLAPDAILKEGDKESVREGLLRMRDIIDERLRNM